MLLYLVQHAEALSKEEDWSRSLSEKGIENINKVSEHAKQYNIKVHQILHSGKMRALQTAQVLTNSVVSAMGIFKSDGLMPMDDPQIWFDRVSGTSEDLMLVGHLPHLSKLASLLLTGNAGAEPVKFEMGGIVCLKRHDDGKWTVEWELKPGMIK